MVDFEKVAALIFLSVFIPLHKVISRHLLSQSMVPFPSHLCLLYHLFQPNRIQQKQCCGHAPYRLWYIWSHSHLFTFIMEWTGTLWKICFNRSVGFHSSLPDLRMFSTLQNESSSFSKSPPHIPLIIRGNGLYASPSKSCLTCIVVPTLGFLWIQLLESTTPHSIHTKLCSSLDMVDTYFCHGAFEWAAFVLVRTLFLG